MSFIALVLLGAGLAMDAFAVSVCKGLNMRRINYRHAFVIALFFGSFQALMPFLGWLLGRQFAKYIESVDHWIAFILLAFIGAKMIVEAVRHTDDPKSAEEEKLDIKELLLLAVATSIDALAVGVTFSFFDVNIPLALATIGTVTFVISFCGVGIGNRFGAAYKNKAEIVGGAVLICLGIYILIRDLGAL